VLTDGSEESVLETPCAELRYTGGRDIPREQAKEEIKAIFASKGDGLIYAGDIMEALDLRYELVADICQELERAGEIQGVKVEYDIHTKVAALLKTGDAGLLRRLVDLLFERYYDPEPLSPKELAAIKEADEASRRGDKDYFIPWEEVKKELDL
jgi:hypothetical protein